MEEIRNYLEKEEKSYQEGLALLSKHCPNRMLVNTLSKRESAAHRAKLEYELEKLASQPTEAKFEQVADLTTAPSKEITGGTIDESHLLQDNDAPNTAPAAARVPYVAGTSSEYDQLLADRSSLYNERCQLSNTLADAASDEEREQIIAKIDTIENARAAMKVKLEYFDQHGKFPEAVAAKPQLSELDKADLIKTRNNLRSQLSKAKKAALAKPGDVAKQEKLAKVEVELNSVELQLKQITDIENQEAAQDEAE